MLTKSPPPKFNFPFNFYSYTKAGKLKSSTTLMDPGLAGPSSPKPKQPSPAVQPIEPALNNLLDLEPGPKHHNADTSCSYSTTSDSSDGDDFFQLDPMGLEHPILSNAIEPAQSNPNFSTSDHAEISLATKHTTRNHLEDQYQNQYQNQIQLGEFRPSQSPPLPPMARNGMPDPNRIPSSVFARTKSTTPMDWSVASNESLFSIHMGNPSFSRDHMFLMGRSGEFNFSSGPMDNYPMPPILPASPVPPPLSPLSPQIPSSPVLPVSSGPTPMDSGNELGQPETAAAVNEEAIKDKLRAAAEGDESDKEKRGPDGIHSSKSVSHQSDGSTSSFRSFAFPILTGAEGRSGSIKAEPAHQRMQSQQQAELQTLKIADNTNTNKEATPTTAAAEEKGWFSCFPCCSLCR